MTICPGFIMGPPLRIEATASIDWVKNLMTGVTTTLSGDGLGYVDMHSTAVAHLRAITVPEAANRRFILVKESHSWHDFACPIIDHFNVRGWNIAPEMQPLQEGRFIPLFDNSASREVLGIEYRDLTTTMVEMAEAMIASGAVVKPEPVAQ